MKDIDLFISKIINEFNVKNKNKNKNKNFKIFLKYVFEILDIKDKNANKNTSKYIKIRNNILSYIVANKQSIVKQIKSKNN